MEYQDFLGAKAPRVQHVGAEPGPLHGSLYPFQMDITRWAIRRGRAAIFADCGLGKTAMQLEWARQSGDKVLILAPLSVASQTITEGQRIGVDVAHVSEPTDDPIQITNYEKLHRFIGHPYDAIVLDESSILKSLDGATRNLLIAEFSKIPRRLCCTATPAPNDISELANHAEFLGVMPRVEMLATYFVHDSDGDLGGRWRLKGHARDAFWGWVATWGMYLRRPSDLGYEDGGFELPPLNIHSEIVDVDFVPEGRLFHASEIGGINERREARRKTIDARVARAVELVRESSGSWVIWCGLNAEGDAITKALGDSAVQIAGSDSEADRIAREIEWRTGGVRALVTKPEIFGFGMNWQHCHQMMFLGLGDSYEKYYQAIRRCWRFGQDRPVDVAIVVSNVETAVADNVARKEREAEATATGVIREARKAMQESLSGDQEHAIEYVTGETCGTGWKIMLGDCIQRIAEVPDASVGMSVFSPPFASLYTYSASERDMGNSKDYDQFFVHFGYLIPELLRITMPGRRCCVHVQQVATTKVNHGVIGWRDFRADTVRAFVAGGWVYDGEVVIDKDPQAQAIRTKSKALMFVQKNKDSSWCRPAMADYILCFRHPDDNQVPVVPDVSNEEWIMWARPIWYGIRESDTLNFAEARTEKDERHICPLQLPTIERCIRLWSNPGETVFSPFAGIGSEGYVALQKGRKFIGVELKEAYYKQAVKNLKGALTQIEMELSTEVGG